jgi:hypothetical protein
VHVTSGSAKYRLLDAKVRVFVAPTVATLNTTPVRTLPPRPPRHY